MGAEHPGLLPPPQQRLSDAQRLARRFGRRFCFAAGGTGRDTDDHQQHLKHPSCEETPTGCPPPLPHQGVVLLDLPADEVMAGEGRVLKKDAQEEENGEGDTEDDPPKPPRGLNGSSSTLLLSGDNRTSSEGRCTQRRGRREFHFSRGGGGGGTYLREVNKIQNKIK